MKITVKILRSNNTKIIDLESGAKVCNLLKKLNIKPDTLIVMKGNSPIPVDEDLNDGDKLSIILVSSGG